MFEVAVFDIVVIEKISKYKVLSVLVKSAYQIKPRKCYYRKLQVDEFWTSKPVLLGFGFAIGFLALLFLAIANEPDYMPSQQKSAMQHDMSHPSNNTATTSVTSEQHAQIQTEAQAMGMTEQQHIHMHKD